MASEIKTLDIQEIKNPNDENYKEIKPENGITYQDSKDYWNSKYNSGFENPDFDKEILYDGKEYKDDNDKVYRIGDELVPNNEYKINGYEYKTDENGRVTEASGQLKMKQREGRREIKDKIETIGKGDEKQNDDRGHLIGDQFDGSNGMENIVAQNKDVNQGSYKNFENQLADKVKAGCDVRISIKPEYSGDSHRPSAIGVNYSIDGKQGTRIFPNE